MKPLILPLLAFASALWVTASAAETPAARKPNIVVIISDDQGYADISFNPQHPEEVSTPHLDSLARESVFFSQAYISGNVCSPTRAGLMTGRYQQRAGVYTAGEGGKGMALTEKLFPQFLTPAGYVSGAFGKWHIGLTVAQGPIGRGFDESYGFLGRGGHDYFKLADAASPMYRGKEIVKDEGYLTTRLTEEASAFITKHRASPFFVYLAYNAVHAPAQAPKEDIERIKKKFPDLPESRVVLMAMLHHLDLGVGRVVETLKKEGVWENTLLFFLTDNGGSKAMNASNTPLRGAKGGHYEGGIRTPFIVSWPARFKGGRKLAAPVIALDILPTALAAAGVAPPSEKPLDGKSLLPLLTGETGQHHRTLFWSEGGATGNWAVRSGDWKIIASKDQWELYNLANDAAEATNLAAQQPEKIKELTALYDAWLAPMPVSIAGHPPRYTPPATPVEATAAREAKRQRKVKKEARKAAAEATAPNAEPK
ncbi:MAG: sulfatase-like hydrolase/transferase [Verrucomicrobiota bacterium]|nr:sulfatase-like hydrolase/transferase [Verrucomicrobiota bacterium]